MSINKNIFIHESDKAALQTLKAIPGFTQVLRAFMKVWDEENMHIRNMAQKVRISEEQLPEYYNMLLPICDKLGIDIPELYLELNPLANAYTTGDSKPAITIIIRLSSRPSPIHHQVHIRTHTDTAMALLISTISQAFTRDSRMPITDLPITTVSDFIFRTVSIGQL